MSGAVTCGVGSVLLDGPDGPVREGVVSASRCARWDCPDCGPLKASRLKGRLVAGLEHVYAAEVAWLTRLGKSPDLAWRPFKFFSLTVHPKRFISAERYRASDWDARPEEAEAATTALMKAWNRMLTWLRWRNRRDRRTDRAAWEGDGTQVRFFRVLELTRRGWPHLHVILLWRRFLPQWTLQRLWAKHGLGEIVDIRNRHRERGGPRFLAFYVSKYLGKQLCQVGMPPGKRRWSCSRSFLPPGQDRRWDGEAGWSHGSVDVHRKERFRAGADIEELRRGFRWTQSAVPEDQPVEGYRYSGLHFWERLRLRDVK